MNRVMIPQLWGTEYRILDTRHGVILSGREGSPRSGRWIVRLAVWRNSRLPTPDSRLPPHNRWVSSALIGIFLVLGTFLLPHTAFADPHAVFYTDRAQEQLFFNTLAALNQADYVEPPDRPPIDADRRLGDFIRTGTYQSTANQPQYQTVRDPVTGQLTVRLLPGSGFPLEPNEATSDVQLPRIRVRQVTSDDGDVYFRERVERRARAEEIRVLLAYIGCKAAEQIYGPDTAEKNKYCPDSLPGVSPGNLPFVL